MKSPLNIGETVTRYIFRITGINDWGEGMKEFEMEEV